MRRTGDPYEREIDIRRDHKFLEPSELATVSHGYGLDAFEITLEDIERLKTGSILSLDAKVNTGSMSDLGKARSKGRGMSRGSSGQAELICRWARVRILPPAQINKHKISIRVC